MARRDFEDEKQEQERRKDVKKKKKRTKNYSSQSRQNLFLLNKKKGCQNHLGDVLGTSKGYFKIRDGCWMVAISLCTFLSLFFYIYIYIFFLFFIFFSFCFSLLTS